MIGRAAVTGIPPSPGEYACCVSMILDLQLQCSLYMPGPHDRARLSQKSRSSDVKVLAVDRGNLKSKMIRDEIFIV